MNYSSRLTHFDIEKKFACDICDYKCTTPYRLKRHKNDHTGIRPFPCNICSYRYANKCIYLLFYILCYVYFSGKSKHALGRHLDTHNTELKFICHNCPYRTNTRELLLKHLRNKCVIKKRGRSVNQYYLRFLIACKTNINLLTL